MIAVAFEVFGHTGTKRSAALRFAASLAWQYVQASQVVVPVLATMMVFSGFALAVLPDRHRVPKYYFCSDSSAAGHRDCCEFDGDGSCP